MRKLIALIIWAGLLAACNNDNEPRGYGDIRLNVNADKEIGSIPTRASEPLTAEELDNYLISIERNGQTVLEEIAYSVMRNTYFSYPVGSGYVAHAANCTEADALTANDNWGQVRYAGQSASYSIADQATTDVAINCTMQNAKVSVAYAYSFTEVFEPGSYTVEVWSSADAGRTLTFDSNASFATQPAYFNASGTETLYYRIRGIFTGSGSHLARRFEGSLDTPLEKQKWYKLTISTANDGEISLNASVDNAVEELEEEVPVSPYG